MTEDVEATKRANVEGLNKAALAHFMKESKDEGLKEWIDLYNTGVWDIEEEEELTDGQELFISLIEGDDEKILDKLYHYLYGNEYCWAHEGGEPELEHILAVKLYEKLRGQKFYMSIIYQEPYLEHVGIKYKGRGKGRVK